MNCPLSPKILVINVKALSCLITTLSYMWSVQAFDLCRKTKSAEKPLDQPIHELVQVPYPLMRSVAAKTPS